MDQDKQQILEQNISSCKINKKQKLVDSIFKPDIEGVSEWVSREKLMESELNWGNNGIGRHGVYFGDNRYVWQKEGTRKITSLRTNGFNQDVLCGASRPIRKDIEKHHKKVGCVVCGSKSLLVTDHKNDLYNDPRVLNRRLQTIDDFQCLCNHCNLQKRQVSKTTLRKGNRIGATSIRSLAVFGIDFIDGDKSFNKDDVDAMKGTYWYDPVEFMKKIKSNLKLSTSKDIKEISIDEMKLVELKEYCKKMNINGCSRKKKEDLLRYIKDNLK